MEAIILAGGCGTRLSTIIKEIPKPMADINGKPFLSYLLSYLIKHKVSKIILSVGYKYDKIRDFFGSKYENLDIEYVIEDKPLGTGGAIKKALKQVKGNEVIVLNGDTFFNVNLENLIYFHHNRCSMLTIAVKPIRNFNRYGTVILIEDKIIGFEEKSLKEFGYINGGIYVINKNVFRNHDQIDSFSFETDFLYKHISDINSFAFISNNYFIDIGIPEDYKRAQQEFKQLFKE